MVCCLREENSEIHTMKSSKRAASRVRKFTTILIATVIATATAQSARALDFSLTLDRPNSSFASATSLTAGDVFTVLAHASNPNQDAFVAIFLSLVHESLEIQPTGGARFDILTEASCTGFLCQPATLSPVAISPTLIKANSPSVLNTGTEAWAQMIAHVRVPVGSNIQGASGPGGEIAAKISFQVMQDLPSTTLSLASTSGDDIGIVLGGGVESYTGPLTLGSLTIIPEPGTATLLGLARRRI